MTCKVCGHEGNNHDFSSGICLDKGCFCMKFEEAIGEDSVFLDYVKYLNKIELVEEKVRFLLTNIKFLRNFTNKDFVFAYWVYCDGLIINKPLEMYMIRTLTDPESIRRAKQKLVQTNKDLYGEFDYVLTDEKSKKQMAITEWAVLK